MSGSVNVYWCLTDPPKWARRTAFAASPRRGGGAAVGVLGLEEDAQGELGLHLALLADLVDVALLRELLLEELDGLFELGDLLVDVGDARGGPLQVGQRLELLLGLPLHAGDLRLGLVPDQEVDGGEEPEHHDQKCD